MVLERAKCDLNGVKIAIFPAKSQKSPNSWGSAPSVTRFSCNGLFNTGPKLDNFYAKKHLQNLSLLAKPWFRFWSNSLLHTDFSSDYTSRIRNELINAAGLISLFFRR